VGDPTLESKLLSAVVGKEISEEELYHIAERIFALNRAILLREGRRGRKDDRLVDFMFIEREEPVADVFGMHNPELLLPGAGDEVISRKGKALDRNGFEEMKDEYYEIRGWDVQTGLPKKETLEKLELSDVADGLQEAVKL
jgi:aldehyde:ferredoxin oxidoreductase